MNKAIRLKVYNKCGGHCAYCGKELEYKRMQVDHVVPVYKKVDPHFGVTIDIDAFENLMPSCSRCNHYKRSFELETFRKQMITLNERIEKHYLNKVAIDYGVLQPPKPFNGVFYFETLTQQP